MMNATMMNTMKKWVTGTSLAAFLLAGGLFPATSEAAHPMHRHGYGVHRVVKQNMGRVHVNRRPVHPGRPVFHPVRPVFHPGRPIFRPRPRPIYYCNYHGRWHTHPCPADRRVTGAVLVGAILGTILGNM